MGPFLPGLIGMGASALACALVLILARLAGGRTGGRWGLPLGLGIGYALGHAGASEWLTSGELPSIPPLNATDWLPWLALAAMVLGLLESLWPSPAWARWENRLLLVGATLWLLIGPLYQSLWEPAQWKGAVWVCGLGAGILVFWGLLEGLSGRRGRAMLLPLAVLAGGTAAALVLSRFLVLGECGMGLAAALGAAWLVSRWWVELSPAGGGVPVVGVLLAGLILGGFFYAELPASSAILLALAPLALLVDRIGPVARWPGWAGGLARLAAVLVPVGAAVALAAMAAPGLEG
jgi:hypothetical protein